MPLYTYKVKDKSGKTISGKMNAESPSAAAKKLKEMEYTIIEIIEQKPSPLSIDLAERFTFIRLKDKVMLNMKLVSLLKAGIPLATTLESLKVQVRGKRFKKILDDIHRNILAGNSLSQGFSLYPRVFPELLVNVTEAGESSGKLTEVLERYADYSEAQLSFRQTIVSALTYPCILIIAAIALGSIFLVYLLPRFVDLFNKVNVPLPLPTLMLLKIGNFFKHYTIHIIGGVVIVVILLKIFSALKFGKIIIDSFKLKLPYVGNLIKKISIARFTRTLGTLYLSGVPILKSLEISQEATGNSIYARAIGELKESVGKGQSIGGLIKDNPLFPIDTVQMISIGEQSGNLNEMLYKVADFYERDVNYAMKNISSLIEPIIILGVGLIVGFLAFSIIMPIFNLMHGIE